MFGYVHQHESLWIICYLSIAYYYDPEFFARARRDCFKISDDKLSILDGVNIIFI